MTAQDREDRASNLSDATANAEKREQLAVRGLGQDEREIAQDQRQVEQDQRTIDQDERTVAQDQRGEAQDAATEETL